MVAFHLSEAWEDGANAEAGGFAAVDARQERVGKAVDHFGAVVAFDERGNAFIAIGCARRMEKFLGHADFRTPGEKRRESGGQDFGRDHEHQAVGDGDESAAHENVGYAIGVVRSDELVAEAESAAEVCGPGFFGNEGIGSSFDDASLDELGAEDAAERGRRFIEGVFDSAGTAMLFEGESGGESGDASADDRDAGHECLERGSSAAKADWKHWRDLRYA